MRSGLSRFGRHGRGSSRPISPSVPSSVEARLLLGATISAAQPALASHPPHRGGSACVRWPLCAPAMSRDRKNRPYRRRSPAPPPFVVRPGLLRSDEGIHVDNAPHCHWASSDAVSSADGQRTRLEGWWASSVGPVVLATTLIGAVRAPRADGETRLERIVRIPRSGE